MCGAVTRGGGPLPACCLGPVAMGGGWAAAPGGAISQECCWATSVAFGVGVGADNVAVFATVGTEVGRSVDTPVGGSGVGGVAANALSGGTLPPGGGFALTPADVAAAGSGSA